MDQSRNIEKENITQDRDEVYGESVEADRRLLDQNGRENTILAAKFGNNVEANARVKGVIDREEEKKSKERGGSEPGHFKTVPIVSNSNSNSYSL